MIEGPLGPADFFAFMAPNTAWGALRCPCANQSCLDSR